MALMICPECGNEVSDQAVACPNCGRPFEAPTVVVPPVPVAPPVVTREPIIVAEPPRNKSFPNWIFVPIIVILAVVALFLFMMMREDSANENDNRTQVNVRLRESETASRTRTVSNVEAQTGTSQTVTTAPPVSTAPVTQVPDSTVSSVPQTAYPTTGTTTTTTTENVQPSKGNLEIKATVAGKTGTPQAVKQERFYLLDKSLDEILSRANIEPEEGDLASTCAAAVIDPARGATRQKCLAAINPHIVYRLTTDAGGKGTFKDVKPDSYYVFGVTKVGTDSYALWNTTVTVNPGENLLNLNGSGSPFSPVGLNNSSNY